MREGYECNIRGKRVGLETQVRASMVPRVTGFMPEDGPFNDDVNTEDVPVNEDDTHVEGISSFNYVLPQARGDEEETDPPCSSQQQLATPSISSFYGKPSATSVKKAQPLYAHFVISTIRTDFTFISLLRLGMTLLLKERW